MTLVLVILVLIVLIVRYVLSVLCTLVLVVLWYVLLVRTVLWYVPYHQYWYYWCYAPGAYLYPGAGTLHWYVQYCTAVPCTSVLVHYVHPAATQQYSPPCRCTLLLRSSSYCYAVAGALPCSYAAGGDPH